ncbi:hypothetical protein ACFHW3_42010, partial [Actinomadura sp. LOL_011]
MDVIDRVGVVIPTEADDPAGDARRLESLGFGHAVLPHDSVTPILLALGATRRLRILPVAAGMTNRLGAMDDLPQASLERLAEPDANDRPLLVDPADVLSARASISRSLINRPRLTVGLTGPHASAVRELALDVLADCPAGPSTSLLYAEDLTVGQTFDLGEHQLTEDDIVSFAERFDPLDFHIDPHLATASPLGILCASGVHTQAVMQRLSARGLHRAL